jgi:hypothetical protein
MSAGCLSPLQPCDAVQALGFVRDLGPGCWGRAGHRWDESLQPRRDSGISAGQSRCRIRASPSDRKTVGSVVGGRDDVEMVLQLARAEPEAGPWRVEPLAAVVEAITRPVPGRLAAGRPVVLAVDGRSSSGKTTLAARMRETVAGSAVVHTDDIALWHSRFGWADLLVEGILMPAHRGEAVAFRPPRWAEHGRKGSIEVPARCPVLIIEGVGAGRSEASHLIDALVWVQSDQQETDRRNLARVGQPGGPQTVRHLREWMAEEIPFIAAQRTWERADLVVAGTPELSCDPSGIVIAPPPVQRG